jgi:uncharacterized protein (TIGR03086 family)
MVDAWSTPAAWDGTTWIAGFEAPASMIGITAVNELVVHGWDVARASGQEPSFDDAVLEPSMEFVAVISGPGSEQMRGEAFGPALPVPDGASTLDQIIAGNGRNPAWRAPA